MKAGGPIVTTYLADLETLERYLERYLEETDAIAREQIASVLDNVDDRLVPTLLESARATVAYVEQVRAFVGRARRNLVDPDDLARAAEAVRQLMVVAPEEVAA